MVLGWNFTQFWFRINIKKMNRNFSYFWYIYTRKFEIFREVSALILLFQWRCFPSRFAVLIPQRRRGLPRSDPSHSQISLNWPLPPMWCYSSTYTLIFVNLLPVKAGQAVLSSSQFPPYKCVYRCSGELSI